MNPTMEESVKQISEAFAPHVDKYGAVAGMVSYGAIFYLLKKMQEMQTELDETKKALNETNIQVQALLDMKKMGEIDAKNAMTKKESMQNGK